MIPAMGEDRARNRRVGLALTIALAVLSMTGVSTALLLYDPRATGADALRTGGLAAGSIVALYALWLNDRRRRVEERRQELDQRRQELDRERYELERQRQDLEDRRTDHDRDRADDERFARAVELLGHETDQVRVGAMHALAGLARTRSQYTQTVLDVLCSYLRRPFDHPKWMDPEELAEFADLPPIPPEMERERHARQTAQRLIIELLPTRDEPDPPTYDLDLTRAWLERFNLSDRVVGRIAAYRCRFRHSTNFSRAVFRGHLALRDSVFLGRIRATESVFEHGLQLRGIRALETCDFDRARFEHEVDWKRMDCAAKWYVRGAEFGAGLDLRHARLHGGIALGPDEPAGAVLLDDFRAGTGSDLPAWATPETHVPQQESSRA